jgi:hypothetical protein
MKSSTISRLLCGIMACTAVATAQIDLSQITSQSVRDRRWIPTAVDSVLIAAQVQSGIATTSLTTTLKPGCAETRHPDLVFVVRIEKDAFRLTEWICFDPGKDGCV